MQILSGAKQVHCLGIGGIGISAIAKLLVAQGKKVSGSDATDSSLVEEARQAGIKTMIGHAEKNLGAAEVVIYSEAVPAENPERMAAVGRGIPELSGAEALAALTEGKRLIAVAGTNGKSTTTALLGLLLEAGGFDPTVLVGSKVPLFPLGNLRPGKSDWFVLEADEFQAKFLRLKPEISVITNIEEDHLDFFRDLDHIRETFQKFIDRTSGRIFLNADDDRCLNDLAHQGEVITYGINGPADYLARNIVIREGRQWFDLLRTNRHEEIAGQFSLQIPGRFNIMNALAALSVALELGVSVEVGEATLAAFPGIWRRFERVGERNGSLIISDYGHHPTAVRVTLEAAREFYPDRRLVLVFQPHHHHRTRALFDEFVDAFAGADALVLSEIYSVAGREQAPPMSSMELVEAVRAKGRPGLVYFGGNLRETEELLTTLIEPPDLVIFMGAGDIDGLARRMVGEEL
ncbi:UDP-N-acetylmuramate--L-alanine ligase [Candidatus Uhrbacteria bacterium]|nr:UDP-N-acetylmuramate--L-alanine ligase [Candidatus Uhrbacteria bacterium]